MFRRMTIFVGLVVLLAATAQAEPVNRALGIAINPITNTVMGDPSLVTDGTFGAAWYSYEGGYYNTCSFIIDLGASYPISSVVLGQSQVYGFTLYSSTDGETWTQRNQVNYGVSTANKETLAVNGAYTARYFKYFAYANWIQYVGVTEFQVFSGDPAPTVPTLTPWALFGLAVLMVGSGAWILRARTARG